MNNFTLKSVVVEEVPTFKICERCEGKGKVGHMIGHVEECRVCSGKGGEWHEAVEYHEIRVLGGEKRSLPHIHYEDFHGVVTKSIILVREHQVCSKCGGKSGGYKCNKCFCFYDEPVHICTITYSDNGGLREDCSHCLKDADGKPTGAEPDTAGEWRIKKGGE